MNAPPSALDVATAYYDHWRDGRFDAAANLLDEGLLVETPVNRYPRRADFVQALTVFGSLVRRTERLTALGTRDSAVLIYDMDVEDVGRLRVAEHFLVEDGRIIALRQIHDTAAVRALGYAGDVAPEDEGLSATFVVDAAPSVVSRAIHSIDGLRGWWTEEAEGDLVPGGRFRLRFAGLDECITFDVGEQTGRWHAVWHCVSHSSLPEWDGTTVRIDLSPTERGTSVRLHHIGLVPTCSCYALCCDGWQHFGGSLKRWAETGRGSPYGA